MLIELRAKNCFSFEEQIIFSMKADMRNKKFSSNVHKENNFNVLKTVGVYGPNNAGKTCLVKCINAVKRIFLNKKPNIAPNLFTQNTVCELGVTFLAEGKKFSYDLHYDVKSEKFLYEKFVEILKDQYGNEKEILWMEKDVLNQQYYCIDNDMIMMMHLMSPNNLLCYVIDASKFEHLERMRNIIVEFGEKIDIINMNNIPMNKTIELMKNKNGSREKIVAFIKNADLYMDNFEYVDMDQIKFDVKTENEKPDEEVLNMKEKLMEQIRLVSTYKGVPDRKSVV